VPAAAGADGWNDRPVVPQTAVLPRGAFAWRER
jgi:hypothetical protein